MNEQIFKAGKKTFKSLEIKVVYLILFCLFTTLDNLLAQDKFIFFDGTLDQLERRATNAGRPYFIYFTSDYSSSTKKLDDETLTDRKFLTYAQAEYIGCKLDGRSYSKEGSRLVQKLSLASLPAIVIFNKYGKEQERLYGFTPPDKLVDALKKHFGSTDKPDKLLSQVSGPTDGYDQGYDPRVDGYLYKVSAKRQPMQGFAIQVGAFTFYHHAFKKLLHLNEKLGYSNILLFARPTEDAYVYKLLLGPFKEQNEAVASQKDLQEKDNTIKSVIVDLSVIE